MADPQSIVPSDAPAPRLPFDQAAMATMRPAMQAVLTEHPEVRSVLVVFDYTSGLNDSDAVKACWLSADGPTPGVPATAGTISNTIRALEMVFGRLLQLEQTKRTELHELLQTLLVQKKVQHDATTPIPGTDPTTAPASPTTSPSSPTGGCGRADCQCHIQQTRKCDSCFNDIIPDQFGKCPKCGWAFDYKHKRSAQRPAATPANP